MNIQVLQNNILGIIMPRFTAVLVERWKKHSKRSAVFSKALFIIRLR